MKRPAVTLENCDAVYDFYATYDADMRRARFAHRVIGTVFRPRVSYLDGVTPGLVERAVEGADVTILSCKHVNMNDPLHLVALTGAVGAFADFTGRTVIPSKRPLFDLRIRRWIDDLGAIPTYRRKDHVTGEGTPDDTVGAEQGHATDRLLDVCADLMRRGKNLAIFPEAERSAKIEGSDPAKVNPLKDGIARIYLKAIDTVTVAIVPIGLCYSDPISTKGRLTPAMVLGTPLTDRYDSAPELMDDLAEAMQAAQTAAFKRQRSS